MAKKPERKEVEIATGTAALEFDGNSGATLFVNGVPSSFIDEKDPRFLAFEYMQQMDQVVTHLFPGPIRALHLGAGACALPWAWAIANPKSRQIAVDIDPLLVEYVRQWFDLPRAPALRIRAQDAALAVYESKPERFDVVVRDVFAGNTTPQNMTTAQFVGAIKATLTPGGIYLANCADRPPLRKVKTELNTLIDHFGIENTALISEKGILAGKRYGNLVLLARKPQEDPPPLANPALERALRSLAVPADMLVLEELSHFAR